MNSPAYPIIDKSSILDANNVAPWIFIFCTTSDHSETSSSPKAKHAFSLRNSSFFKSLMSERNEDDGKTEEVSFGSKMRSTIV